MKTFAKTIFTALILGVFGYLLGMSTSPEQDIFTKAFLSTYHAYSDFCRNNEMIMIYGLVIIAHFISLLYIFFWSPEDNANDRDEVLLLVRLYDCAGENQLNTIKAMFLLSVIFYSFSLNATFVPWANQVIFSLTALNLVLLLIQALIIIDFKVRVKRTID